MSYQDRIDIDKLYALIWDNDSNQFLLVTKEDFEAFKESIGEDYYNKTDSNGLYSAIEHSHNYTTQEEVQEIVDEAVSGEQVKLTGYLKKSTVEAKKNYTIDQLLAEKSDTSDLTTHEQDSTAHGINTKADASTVNSHINNVTDAHNVANRLSSAISTHNSTFAQHNTDMIRSNNHQFTNFAPDYYYQYYTDQTSINNAIDTALGTKQSITNLVQYNTGNIDWSRVTDSQYPSALAVKELVNAGGSTVKYAQYILATNYNYTDIKTYYDPTAVQEGANAQWLFEHITTKFKSIDSYHTTNDGLISALQSGKSDTTHKHTGWEEVLPVQNPYSHLYVNEDIQCAELSFSKPNVNLTESQYNTLFTLSNIRLYYPPVGTLYNVSYRPEIMVQLETDGSVKARSTITKNSLTISGNFFWHYVPPSE